MNPSLAIITFPEDPDSWSNSLTPPEGSWGIGVYGDATIDVDPRYKSVGDYSIHIEVHRANIDGTQVVFTFNTPVDISHLDHFQFDMAYDSRMNPYVNLYLKDANGTYAIISFTQTPGTAVGVPGPWTRRSFGVTEWEYYPEGAVFDWTRVTEIMWWIAGQTIGNPATAWIDAPHFYGTLKMYDLRILSSPTGRDMTFEGARFTTPYVIGCVENVQYTINADPDNIGDFVKWENGSTDPVRTIAISAPATITAYYSGGLPPPPPNLETMLKIALIGGATIAAFYLAYRFLLS